MKYYSSLDLIAETFNLAKITEQNIFERRLNTVLNTAPKLGSLTGSQTAIIIRISDKTFIINRANQPSFLRKPLTANKSWKHTSVFTGLHNMVKDNITVHYRAF